MSFVILILKINKLPAPEEILPHAAFRSSLFSPNLTQDFCVVVSKCSFYSISGCLVTRPDVRLVELVWDRTEKAEHPTREPLKESWNELSGGEKKRKVISIEVSLVMMAV